MEAIKPIPVAHSSSLLRPLHRRLLAALPGGREIVRGVDQGNVGQRLREVSGLAPRHGIVFLREQPDVVGNAHDAIEQALRLVEIA